MDWTSLLPDAIARFADRLDATDPSAWVPACPGWRVADLAEHLGGVHQWVTHAVLAGDPDATIEAPPPGSAALGGWYRAHASRMVEVLVEAGPDAPAWTFGPRPRTTAFWWRRQVHETLMHSWDLASASPGDAAPPVADDPALAADGIDEVVAMFVPRQVRLGRLAPLDATLVVDPDDAPGRWELAAHDGRSRPDAVLSGPADVLLLALWKRAGLDDPRLRLTGDRAAAARVLGSALTP